MPDQLLAWFADPDLKAEVVARMKRHRVQDEIIQGKYQIWTPAYASKYRGCALGCTLPYVKGASRKQSDFWPREVERQYGISKNVAAIIDETFESLPASQAGDFAVAVIEAIPVGADLSEIACAYLVDFDLEEEECHLRPCFACSSDMWDRPEPFRDRFIAALVQAPVPG